jgi:predicted nucleic acid-binding protein
MSGAALTCSVDLLQQLAVGIDDGAPRARDRELLELARAGQLSWYDAGYLEFALRLGLPLASKDAPRARMPASQDAKLRKAGQGSSWPCSGGRARAGPDRTDLGANV